MTESIRRRWATLAAQPAAAETLAVPLLAVGVGLWLSPDDPFWVKSDFPWTWLAPVLVSLHYGPLAGVTASGVLVLAWFALSASGSLASPFPRFYFLGGFILVLLTGEFSSLWMSRVRRAETLSNYLDERLERLTEQYYLLRLSHDRLEQELLTRPLTLRDALGRLTGGVPLADSARTLLDLLAQYAQLQRAALYPIHDGVLSLEPVAVLGEPFALDPLDPLVRYALDQGRLAHVRDVLDHASSRYRVVAPAAAKGEAPTLLLVVERLPFLALHEETLQSLNLLLAYYADGLAMKRLAAPLLAHYPDCPPAFALELMRLARLWRENRLASSLVVFHFTPKALAADLPRALSRLSRGTDLEWFVEPSARLLVILPLTGEAGAEGYTRRIERWFAEHGRGRPEEAGVRLRRLSLNQPPLTLLARALEDSDAE
jgi:hypothetical protein